MTTDEEHNQTMGETISLTLALENLAADPAYGQRQCILYDVESRDWYGDQNDGVERDDAITQTVDESVEMLTNDRHWPETRFLIDPDETRPATTLPEADTKPKTILLNRSQCLEHMDVLKLKQCYIVYGYAYYKEPVGSGTTSTIDNAVRTTVPKALDLSSSVCRFELIDQELAGQIFTSVSVVHILGQHLVELLKLTPLNPTARAKVMAVMGQMPPTDADTWDKLQDWVKETHKVKSATTPAKPVKKPEFTIALQFSDVETGTCRYTVRRSGESNEKVSLEKIASLIEEKDFRSVEQLVRELIEYVKADAETPDMDWNEHVDYANHDCSDETNFDVSCGDSHDRITSQLTQYLVNNMPPETLRRLGL